MRNCPNHTQAEAMRLNLVETRRPRESQGWFGDGNGVVLFVGGDAQATELRDTPPAFMEHFGASFCEAFMLTAINYIVATSQ